MFRKENLISRYAFLLIDLICVVLAVLLANFIRYGELRMSVFGGLYYQTMIVALAACIFANFATNVDTRIFDRGYYQEFLAVLKSAAVIVVAMIAYLFFSQNAINYSRLQMIYMPAFYVAFSYAGHLIAKPLITGFYRKNYARKRVLLVTSADKVSSILDKLEETNNWYFELAYIILLDVDRKGESIRGVPVIATANDMLEACRDLVVDGVFINTSYASLAERDLRAMLRDFQAMGVIVHINIDALELDVTDKVIENLGSFKVVSYANKLRRPFQMLIKRLMDFVGGLIGAILTVIVGVFVVPAIMIESPGAPIFSQVRVGRNGRHFNIYKFRSMYQDAEERKKDLTAQNEMEGAMFKIADDPRITKVGRFIRKYSIDEMPQFFNVLMGNMSLVGTRPPTVEEVEQYRVDQKRRLSVTPGITGLWQTSGRSDIYDFDEIVKLDLQYIDQWNLGLDLKLLVKTIVIVFGGKGAK